MAKQTHRTARQAAGMRSGLLILVLLAAAWAPAAAAPAAPARVDQIVASAPGCAYWPGVGVLCAVLGADNQVWTNTLAGAYEPGVNAGRYWQVTSGEASAGRPTVAMTDNNLYVLARGADNALWFTTYNWGTAHWAATTRVAAGAPLGSDPDCTGWEADRLACAALTETGAVELLLYQEGGAWSAGDLSGVITRTFSGPPALTYVPKGTSVPDAFFTVFARDGGAVYRASRAAAATGWNDWTKAFDASADADCAMAGTAGYCVVGESSGGVTLWSWTGGDAPVSADLGGAVATRPEIVLTNRGRPLVFAGGADHRLWSKIYDGAAWGPWFQADDTRTAYLPLALR